MSTQENECDEVHAPEYDEALMCCARNDALGARDKLLVAIRKGDQQAAAFYQELVDSKLVPVGPGVD